MATVLKEEAGTRAELPLPSFRAAGFRAFRDLSIGELGRVNLFVGRNNTGKSSLLEAIHLYAGGATPERIQQLLLARDEITTPVRSLVGPDVLDSAVNRLFYGNGESRVARMTLGPVGHPKREMIVDRGWATVFEDDESIATHFTGSPVDDVLGTQERALAVHVGYIRNRTILDGKILGRPVPGTLSSFLHPAKFVPASGIPTEDLASAWDQIALTDEEDLVASALRIIAPGVERISVVGDVDGARDRRFMVRIAKQRGPIPLRSMGDGMNRLLGIALALAAVRDGILLVDEIENGLHYSVQADVWRMILRAAESLNVQVFATTHSWDCIRAFAAATSSTEDVSAMLYRLDTRVAGEVRAVRYTADEVAIAAEQQIEVR